MTVGPGGRRQRRVWLGLAVIGGVATLLTSAWVWGQVGRGQGAADTASLVSLALSVVGLIVGIAGLGLARAALGQPVDAAAQAVSAAATLARQVERAESEQWRVLVGKDWARINLRYTLHAQALSGDQPTEPRGQLFSSEATHVPDIAAFYRHTETSRLVVTGAPGAGKTVLALELLLKLIESRTEQDPVPVRVSLAQWDMSVPLEDFLTSHLVDVYDWPRGRAEQLLEHGFVLPVLDGLDEMDSFWVDGDGVQLPDSEPRRARSALMALNEHGRGLRAGPLILTCRSSHYDALPEGDRLQRAARISIAPVSAAEALRYLTDRHHGGGQWQPLLEHLRSHPTGVLARSLSTPWRLCLTATIYGRGGDPTELLELFAASDVDRHLLANFIPASHHLHPRLQQFTPEQTHTWLATLARHLGSRTEIHLHELWPIAGRLVLVCEYTLSSLFFFLLTFPLIWITPAPAEALTVVALATAMAGPIVLFFPYDSRPARPSWRAVFTPTARSRLGTALLNTALITFLTAGLFSLEVALYLVLPAGISAAIFAWTTSTFHLQSRVLLSERDPKGFASRPGEFIRADILAAMWTGMAWGFAMGLPFAGILTFGQLKANTLSYHPAINFIFGVTIWSVALFIAESDVSRRYISFTLCARWRNLLPLRLNTFLYCAYDAGLLRISGNAYQFRHRELQQWLIANPHTS